MCTGSRPSTASRRISGVRQEYPISVDRSTTIGRVALEGKTVNIHDVLDDPDYTSGYKSSVIIVPCLGSLAERGNADRLLLSHPFGGAAIYRPANRARADLRRPGGHRDRERTAVQRDAGGAGTADRDGRYPEGDREFARRTCSRCSRRLRSGRTGSSMAGRPPCTALSTIVHLMAFTPTSPEADAALRARFPRPLSEVVWGEAIGQGKCFESPTSKTDLSGSRLCGIWHGCAASAACSLSRCCATETDRRDQRDARCARHVRRPSCPVAADLRRSGGDRDLERRAVPQVQDRTRELSQSLDDLRTAQDRLVQTEKLASLGQLTAGIAHEIKNPLNFVNNFSALSAELTDELNDSAEACRVDRQDAGGSRRADKTTEGQSRKGRAARQARQLHCQEHAAAFARRLGRAAARRRQRAGG